LGCNCGKNKTRAVAGRQPVTSKVTYEVFDGDLDEPVSFDKLSEARLYATEHKAKLRSTVVRLAAPVPEPVG